MTSKDRLPAQFYKYFWEINPQNLSLKERPEYIAERLLEYADLPGWRWLTATFPPSLIKKIVSQSRRLSKKSANFYAFIFNINPKKILCLSKDFRRKHKKIWNS